MTQAEPILAAPPAPASRPGAEKRSGGAQTRTKKLPPPTGKSGGGLLPKANWGELSIPLAVLAIVLAMITPLPPILLDLLISANIAAAVIVLMSSMYIRRPVDFSVFPTALLLMTLFRLALNVSSARLILLNGNTGTSAAGEVIQAFGAFVVGGNYVIGVVIFLVLIAIQYVVINHGAVRISEVTARFTLDAMPGKQMSIDSDLNAGLIDETEARARRKQLTAEAEFFGAMDGASRFTQRDAVASILITGINIVAGFLIGVLQHGLDLQHALETYTVLTIGDGLVTVIPALMISVSGGLIVTRASSDNRLAADFRRQIFTTSEPLMRARGVLLGMALLPGLPKLPCFVRGGGLGAAAWRLRGRPAEDAAAASPTAAPKENLESLMKVEPLAIEVGLGLVKLVEGGQNSPLLRRIGSIRRQLATDLGCILPPVRVTDNLALRAREYAVSLKGAEIARFEMPQGCELAISPGPNAPPLDGIPTREPAFGIAAVWIAPESAEKARAAGYTVVDATSVVGTHLGELARRYAWELFSRQDAKRLLDRVAEESPKTVEDLAPKLLSLPVIQKVMQNLLRERAPIRDAVTLLESLGEAAPVTRNPVLLTEYARQAIRRQLLKPYLNPRGELSAWFLDPAIEQAVENSVEHSETSSHFTLAPQRIRDIVQRIQASVGAPETGAVLLVGSGCRYFLRQAVEASLPNLAVVSHSEVPPGVKVVSLGTVK